MEGRPIIPEGSGDEESPELAQRAADHYELSMRAFEDATGQRGRLYHRRRRMFRDYTAKNCEEAYGQANDDMGKDDQGNPKSGWRDRIPRRAAKRTGDRPGARAR